MHGFEMNEFDASQLAGFCEGMTFASLRASRHRGPDQKPGVYVVVYPFEYPPKFLEAGSGGWFKNRDPNVDIQELWKRWVRSSRLLYVGKAGAPGESVDLRDRISLFSRYGRGSNASHWGGRYIWQVEQSEELIVRWRPTPNEVPRRIERRLIEDFVAHYGKRPFANLRD